MRDLVDMWEGYHVHHPSAAATAPLPHSGDAVVHHPLPAAVASPTAGVLLRMPRLFPAAAAAAFRATRVVSGSSGGAAGSGSDDSWER